MCVLTCQISRFQHISNHMILRHGEGGGILPPPAPPQISLLLLLKCIRHLSPLSFDDAKLIFIVRRNFHSSDFFQIIYHTTQIQPNVFKVLFSCQLLSAFTFVFDILIIDDACNLIWLVIFESVYFCHFTFLDSSMGVRFLDLGTGIGFLGISGNILGLEACM